MRIFKLRHAFVAVLLLVAMLCQETWALAGTTGRISGTLTDSTTGKPVASAKITATSPSQSASTTTDAAGQFNFLTLAPDSYTVSVDKEGYAPVSVSGVTVFADQSQTLSMTTHPELKTIARVVSRAAGNLVKPGTTSDVYSVNAATQQVLASSGGGFNLNAAYSAVYAQPGVTSYIGNYGWGQVFYIRGGSYSQTGYEFDGVPVNRAFDNYQANSLSSLGQQELQVYTGGSPAGASSATLGGFINQVIKTGTYPGFGTLTGGLGAPGFYHSLQAEAGGANPNRTFSYYVGLLGYNQHFPYGSWNNLGDLNPDGTNQYGLTGPAEISTFYGGLLCGIGTGCPDYIPALQAPGFDFGFYGNGPYPACTRATGAPANYTPSNPGTYGATCFGYTPFGNGYQEDQYERDSVVNLHFAIPHKYDSGRDDIQLLYDNSMQYQLNASEITANGGIGLLNDYDQLFAPYGNVTATGAPYTGPYAGLCGERNFNSSISGGCVNGVTPFAYSDSQIFAPGTTFGQSVGTATVAPYYFPSSPTNRALFTPYDQNLRDGFWNDVGIVKLQYQKNIGSNAYARIFGYTFYSDWMINGPTCASTLYLNGTEPGGLCGNTPDYELATHTRGAQLELADQINSQHLLNFTANYTTAGVTRFNNGTWRSASSSSYRGVTNLTNGDPNNPECFSASTGDLTSCLSSSSYGRFPAYYQNDPQAFGFPSGYNTLTQGQSADPCAAGELAPDTPACRAGAKWLVTVPGGQGTYNIVKPVFSSAALTDDFKPNDRLDINLGIRFEDYRYDLSNTNTPEFNYWFNAEAQVLCYDPGTGQPMLTPLLPGQPIPPGPNITATPFGKCGVAPSGKEGLHPVGKTSLCNGVTRFDCGSLLYSAASPSSFDHSLWSPRLGMTYTLSRDTVLRATIGRYTQPTETAFEQYIDQSGKRAAAFNFTQFWGLGFNTPGHDNPVQYSNNYDFSIEHQFHNTDISVRVSPFYRDTHNEIVTVPLGPGFVSGVNLGHQHSYGVEVALDKGDPSRDGFSGGLSYTYTKALIQYGSPPSGVNAIDYLNNYIVAFNKLTKAGGGSPCYDDSGVLAGTSVMGVGVPCPANFKANPQIVVNPYYNSAVQSPLDRNGWYNTYPNEPPNDPSDAPFVGSSAIVPHMFSGWLQYKHDKWAISPNFVLQAGSYYGAPTDIYGVDPRTCLQNQAQVTTLNTSTGKLHTVLPPGSPAAGFPDFLSCTASASTASGLLAVPDAYTGVMDNMGAFQQPWQFNLGARLAYQVSPRITASLDLTNIYNVCFGGSSQAWSKRYAPGTVICGYGNNSGGYLGPVQGQPGYGGGFYYGTSPTDKANGGGVYAPVNNYPYGSLFGALPFQAYLQVQIKL